MNKHIDFKDTNTFWTWVPVSDGYDFNLVEIENLCAGDTDSAMFTLPNEMTSVRTKDEIIEVANSIGERVNGSFADWAMFAFNCPEDRTHYLAADREVVASSGLFLGKKHYVMNVVDDEGQEVNKKKIMGIELKRSSASTFLKEVLYEIVDAILNWKSEKEIRDIFMYYKEDIVNRDITEIAVPSSCKTLNKAVEQYQNTGSKKNIHITAKSALNYNLRRNEHDPIINTGDKVYMVYIVDPDKSIAFPVDEEPPQWLLDIPVDHEKMWERVENAVSHYLIAMEWDFNSKKESVRQNLFGF